jgi:LacI family transcriptional regulator
LKEKMKSTSNSTMKDIQKATGLGLATISKYINGGTVRPNNKALLDRAVAELGYQRNEYARALKTNRARTVGVVIPELSSLFCTSIITSIEDVLRQKGYAVIVCDCRSTETLEQNAIEFLLSKKVDGILNMPVSTDGRALQQATDQGTPVVLFDRRVACKQYSAVTIDNRNASALAVEHLAACGHKRIGLIYGGNQVFTFRERLQGYREAMDAFGAEQDCTLECAVEPTLAGGYSGMKKLMQEADGMTAVFTTNYEMTLGAVIAANEAGIRIPDSLSFIGFDNLELSKVMTPKLTIVTQPMEEIAYAAANLMLDELEDGTIGRRQVVLGANLIQGTSVVMI